ncbi:MAG: hypothetical protein P4L33_02865 [Capsulimonadaceae bacterium]|nr:hypothetical protein [Capsulimonadaceae bacterium]
MENKLLHEPEFDFDDYRAKLGEWKTAGAQKVAIDWSTGSGPSVVYAPSTDRSLATTWSASVSLTHYSELYADFIEYTLAPRLVEMAQGSGLTPLVRCVDQQPVLVQRQRRREIEAAEHALANAR